MLKTHLVKDSYLKYRKLLNFNSKKTNSLIKKWAEDLNRHLKKEDTQRTNKHMKRCSSSCVSKEMQIKTTVRHHYAPIRMVKIWDTGRMKC